MQLNEKYPALSYACYERQISPDTKGHFIKIGGVRGNNG